MKIEFAKPKNMGIVLISKCLLRKQEENYRLQLILF